MHQQYFAQSSEKMEQPGQQHWPLIQACCACGNWRLFASIKNFVPLKMKKMKQTSKWM